MLKHFRFLLFLMNSPLSFATLRIPPFTSFRAGSLYSVKRGKSRIIRLLQLPLCEAERGIYGIAVNLNNFYREDQVHGNDRRSRTLFRATHFVLIYKHIFLSVCGGKTPEHTFRVEWH